MNAITKITMMITSESHRGISNVVKCASCRYSMTQLEAHPRDDDEGAVHERRIALNQDDQLADHQPHRDDPQNPAGHDDPQLR